MTKSKGKGLVKRKKSNKRAINPKNYDEMLNKNNKHGVNFSQKYAVNSKFIQYLIFYEIDRTSNKYVSPSNLWMQLSETESA